MQYSLRSLVPIILCLAVFTTTARAQTHTKPHIKVLAFDAFPVFDPRPVFTLAEQLYPGKGQELSNAWRTRQFEYQWLRVLSGKYQNFERVTEDALVYAAKSLKLELTDDKRKALLDAYRHLKLWPDVLPALQALHAKGIQLVFLSNMTEGMLLQNMQENSIANLFAGIYSTDLIKDYKPSARAYKLAMDRMKLKKSDIGFVAFAGWDAAGAKAFGYTTYWVNRQNQPNEELGTTPDWTGNSLKELAEYLGK